MANPGDRLAQCIFDRWSALPSILCCDMYVVKTYRYRAACQRNGRCEGCIQTVSCRIINDQDFKSAIVLHRSCNAIQCRGSYYAFV